MKFTLDSKDMFSHLVLNNTDVAKSVASTDAWMLGETLEATLKINGVDVPAEVLDNLLHKMWDQAQVDSGQENFKLRVREEAERILKDQNHTIYELANSIQEKLEAYQSEIKFPWED